jgi:rRNA-processing protein FCF1
VHGSTPSKPSWIPFTERLRNEIIALSKLGDELLDASRIDYVGARNRDGGLVFSAPDWEWAEPTDDLRRIQMRLVPRFDRCFERLSLLFSDAPSELKDAINEVREQIRDWLARDGKHRTWDLPHDIESARTLLRERFSKLAGFLDVLPAAESPLLAVPDTSALIAVPQFERYSEIFGVDKFEIAIVSGVLSELDGLKDQGRNQEVRERARIAVRAIKDLRQRGSLLDGVQVVDGVTVFIRPVEPVFDRLPGRLDPSVPDDRILAAVFELQRERPRGAVVLVTGDVNLQTKAELAGIPFIEPPELAP